MALSITILVTDGEKVIAQAASELTTELHLKDFIEKTIPGFEETAKGLLQLTEKEVEQVVTEVETESKGWFSK